MRKLVKGGSSNERAFVLQENFMNHRKHSRVCGQCLQFDGHGLRIRVA